jgi:hypothetical protein
MQRPTRWNGDVMQTPSDPIDQQRFDALLRQALATPPISNEEIERRSKQAHRKTR